jgi:23S rRNA (cytidine1920-2'-O)/16S rRNA (cytidine1409-2'-O)-methyltransferase
MDKILRGTLKLRAALAAFQVSVFNRVVLDVGASTGGFCVALLEAGAEKIYAVDAGFGQLLGSLRQSPRIINMERTNLADFHEEVDLITLDLSYLSIARAAPQLPRAKELIALVKPQFELGLARAPTDHESLGEAIEHAASGLEGCGWTIVSSIASPIVGIAREGFLHATFSA